MVTPAAGEVVLFSRPDYDAALLRAAAQATSDQRLDRHMKGASGDDELPLGWQFAGLSGLWIAWLSAIAWVHWKAKKQEEAGYYIQNEFLVYGVLYAGIPLLLVVTGLLFIYRVGPVSALPLLYRRLYWIFACLTLVAALVFVFLGLSALTLPSGIRE